jgi:catechol 2,3-dioxygenase-like lactoylglutathione lyase family enzyme
MSVAVVHQLDHVALAVMDLDRSRRWYEEVLGLERRYEDAWPDFPVMLCAGEACIALFPLGESDQTARPQTGFPHIAFRTDRAAFEAARRQFERRGWDSRFEDHGICHSLYLSDPDGYQIEVTTYEFLAD